MLHKVLLSVLVLAVAGGCSEKGYVRTSFENQRGFHRTARDVQASEKNHGKSTDARRDLLEIQQYLAAGEFAIAKREAIAVLKKDPNSADGHTYLAVALDQGGDAAGAGQHYLRAAEVTPNSGAALGNYGVWLCEQGRAAESLTWFDRAVAIPGYGNQAMVLANAGVCAGKAGQQERADRDLRRAIAVDPANAAALGALAEREFRAGNAFEARAFSERRLAAAPADRQALLLASQIEEKLGDRAAAARYVARLNAEFPDASDARNSSTGDGGRK
ncbi:MAG TPA: type IV pilus biogenesis/stability protein PilW [Lysobacter sp.]|jgi:type IV pilus assembly protein PilF|nr:type IV pilus biogenesis/stability protein PilW [Lysobacter sp.]